ncbi:MAG: hypothetical protein ABI643_00830 [Candidatus Doudnabacteria bacterium]
MARVIAARQRQIKGLVHSAKKLISRGDVELGQQKLTEALRLEQLNHMHRGPSSRYLSVKHPSDRIFM